MQLLIIEDDPQIGQSLIDFLTQNGYQPTLVDTAVAGINALFASTSYQLAIIDWLLPDHPGPWAITKIRAQLPSLPILMLTAKSRTEDVVTGLDIGADDYLTKPFVLTELLARVRALIRRHVSGKQTPIVHLGSLDLDTGRCQAFLSHQLLRLSPKEYALLEYLSFKPNQVCSRLELMDQVWGDQLDELSNTVDVHIRYLRLKLGSAATIIKTVKNRGYMLCPN
jgi:DNA-binding response OmpR family regulator